VSTQGAVRGARAAATWLPRAALDGAARRGGSALHNARAARTLLRTAVSERAELTRLLLAPQDPNDDVPGTLTMLDPDECLRLLGTRTVGRLAYVARAGVPDIAPVNYGVADGCILIRSGAGPKLQAADRRELVAFEVDDLDEAGRGGWSVVVHGRAERVTQGRRQDPSEVPEPWAAGPRVHTIRITPRRITGRRIAGITARSPAEGLAVDLG
jgi:nitroimidazol reductase NimA-like FMN-containing flavoprotein (pyridoxamine 5'-phosphate oxidase superfamily)